MNSKRRSMVLISGGIDSAVLAYQLAQSGEEILLVHADFGLDPKQRELRFVHLIAEALEKELKVIPLREQVRSILDDVSREDFLVGELDCRTPSNGKSLPSGFPVLLSIATYQAMWLGISSIYVAVEGDQARRKRFPCAVEKWQSGMFGFNSDLPEVLIRSPFADRSKAEVIRLGVELGVPLEHSWSCFQYKKAHCGICDGCKARRRAFEEAEITDPTVYLASIHSETKTVWGTRLSSRT